MAFEAHSDNNSSSKSRDRNCEGVRLWVQGFGHESGSRGGGDDKAAAIRLFYLLILLRHIIHYVDG